MTQQTLVVKIGGTVAADEETTAALLAEIGTTAGAIVLVHGGGKTVSAVSARLGMEPRFRDGIRITTPAEMDVVDMVLAGQVNTALVRLAAAAGVAAVGLTGADASLLTGRIISPEDAEGVETRTARPLRVDPAVIRAMTGAGYLPVVATVGTGEDGGAVNINADDAAQAIAEALGDATLCYLSDIPGVLDGAGLVIRDLDPGTIEDLIRDGVARDGMAAKLRSCAAAVGAGVRRVMIGQFRSRGDLAAILSGEHGTTVRPPRAVEEHGGTEGARR